MALTFVDRCAAALEQTQCVDIRPNEDGCDLSFYGKCSCEWTQTNTTEGCTLIPRNLADDEEDHSETRVSVRLCSEEFWWDVAAAHGAI
eukprot:3672986-Rhodomonas_salina.1